MTTSKFRRLVREVAALILADHKWRKASVQFSSRHIGRGNVGCIILSNKRVWWFLSSKYFLGKEEYTDIMKNYHVNSFPSNHKFFGVTLVSDNHITCTEQRFSGTIATEILTKAKSK